MTFYMRDKYETMVIYQQTVEMYMFVGKYHTLEDNVLNCGQYTLEYNIKIKKHVVI